jgi:hypothetical protein
MDMPIANDPVPSSVRALLQLLAGELAAVKFPDVDGERLTGAAREVEVAATAVAEAEAALELARRRLSERQDALLGRAHRALGYLRVFADGDVALEAKLGAIALPRRGRPAGDAATAAAAATTVATGEQPPRKRGRPPKRDPGAPLLAAIHGEAVAAESAPAVVAVVPLAPEALASAS